MGAHSGSADHCVRTTMLVFLLISCAAAAPACPEPEQVSLGALASRVHNYAERPITVCGTLLERSKDRPSEYIFWAGPGSHFSVYLDATKLENASDNQRACITGIARRRDGLPVAEVLSRRMSETYNPEGLQNPEYVLYPSAECTVRPSS